MRTTEPDWVEQIHRKGEVAEANWVVHKLQQIYAADGSPHGPNYMIFCPACQCGHGFDDRRWIFNGDMVKPTLLAAPDSGGKRSVITHYFNHHRNQMMVCHFNIDSGTIFFHGDSQHELAGKTLPLETF